MSRNYWPNVASRSTTSRCTGGCSGFTPLLADAARFTRHSPSDRWFVDETYVKVNGV
jgi:transposase-like protein